MSRIFTAFTLAALLAGCDGENPFQAEVAAVAPVVPVTPPTTPIIDPDNPVNANGIPTVLANDLQSVAYNPVAGTLSVDMLALDRTDSDIPLQAYTPNASLTALAPGYEVFTYQDDPLDRMFVAIVAQDANDNVVGAIVMDGGQFTKFFGGGFYATDGNYTPGTGLNDTGLVSYAGDYAALTNLDANGNELLVPGGTPNPAILPGQPAQISGSIFINADFGDNTVNGAIYDRAFQNLAGPSGPILAVPDVYLIPTAITDAGTFFGEVEHPAQENVGAYGGTFGGVNAQGVAGTTNLDGDWLPTVENEAEFGVFVLTQCGQAGQDPICASIPVSP